MYARLATISGIATVLAGGAAIFSDAGPANVALVRSDLVLGQAFHDYKYAGQAPLPVRYAREDWAGARARARRDRAVEEWVAGRQSRLEKWIADFNDKPADITGWPHDLVNEKSRLPVRWSPDMPEPPNITPLQRKIHGAWVFYRRKANINNILEAARLYRIGGNRRYLDWAAYQIDFYAENYDAWPINRFGGGYSQLMGQNLDEATSAVTLVNAARLMDDDVSRNRRKAWDDHLFLPMLRNLQRSNLGRNNISVWQASASAIIAIHLGLRNDYDSAIHGANGIDAMLSRGVLEDYTWFEPSSAYALYTVNALTQLFIAASLAGRGQDLRKEMLLTQNILLSYATMRFEDGHLPATGDSSTKLLAFPQYILADSQRVIPVHAPAMPLSWEQLLDPGEIPPEPLPAENRSGIWKAAQLAMLRKAGWEIFFQYGQRTSSHAQRAALSYELRYRGTVISGAPGVAAYGSPLFLDYLRQSVAHNMPLIDGAGQANFEPGTLLDFADDHVAATHPGFGVNVQVSRRLEAGATAFVDHMAIATPDGAHRLGMVFNTGCKVGPARAMMSGRVPAGQGFSYWKEVWVSPAAAQWTAAFDCAGARFTFVLTSSVPGRVFLSSAPDSDGRMTRTAIYLEATGVSLKTDIAISPSRSWP